MARLPKKYIKKYGISKRAWREYKADLKGKPYKKRTTTSKVVGVRKVAKRAKRAYRRYRAKRKRRKKDKRISIIGTAGAVGSVFIPRKPDQASMGKWLYDWGTGAKPFKVEDMNHFLADTVGQYTGFDWRKEQPMWSIPWATVAMIATAIASKIANKYAGKYIKNLPFVGKYVKF